MSEQVSTAELRIIWESAAPGWAKWESEFSRHLVAATEMLLDMASVAPDMRVLDLACGAGSQTMRAAKRVGDGGSVLACDISEEMLKNLRRNAEQAGLNNIETLRSAAEDLASSEVPFDAAFSRLGLMLFAAPQSALMAVRSMLKPGGRFAALVFSTAESNPFQSEPMAILMRHGKKPPPQPGQPGLFALGGAGVLEGLLRHCGFADIKIAVTRASLGFASADDALTFLQQAAGAYRAVISDLSDDAKADAWAEVRECLGKYENETGFEAEIELVIGSGANPGL